MTPETMTLLTAVGLFVAIVAGIIGVWVKWPKSEPRRWPSLEAHFATREALEHTDQHIRDLSDKTDVRFAAMSAASSSGREKIYARLGTIEQSLSEQGNEDKNLNARLTRMETKIDRLLEKYQ